MGIIRFGYFDGNIKPQSFGEPFCSNSRILSATIARCEIRWEFSVWVAFDLSRIVRNFWWLWHFVLPFFFWNRRLTREIEEVFWLTSLAPKLVNACVDSTRLLVALPYLFLQRDVILVWENKRVLLHPLL